MYLKVNLKYPIPYNAFLYVVYIHYILVYVMASVSKSTLPFPCPDIPAITVLNSKRFASITLNGRPSTSSMMLCYNVVEGCGLETFGPTRKNTIIAGVKVMLYSSGKNSQHYKTCLRTCFMLHDWNILQGPFSWLKDIYIHHLLTMKPLPSAIMVFILSGSLPKPLEHPSAGQ